MRVRLQAEPQQSESKAAFSLKTSSVHICVNRFLSSSGARFSSHAAFTELNPTLLSRSRWRRSCRCTFTGQHGRKTPIVSPHLRYNSANRDESHKKAECMELAADHSGARARVPCPLLAPCSRTLRFSIFLLVSNCVDPAERPADRYCVLCYRGQIAFPAARVDTAIQSI
jgi:hypothetical protein